LAQFSARSIVALSFLTIMARERVIMGPPDKTDRSYKPAAPSFWAIRRRNVTFRLARGHPILYEVEVARRREAPRREFFWLGQGRPLRRKPQSPHRRAMTNPFEFIQQVRAEAAKVVWPTRRETLITTGLVLVLVVFTSLFFVVVDQVLRQVVSLALGFGRGG
jgi:preprotein translocase subunit SecE